MGLPVLQVHRDTDTRICAALTTVVNQDDVFANFLLVASHGDICTHGAGALTGNANEVYVHEILVAGHTASGALCGLSHAGSAPTTEGSPDVFVGS
mgnify:CR=1 FL=1